MLAVASSLSLNSDFSDDSFDSIFDRRDLVSSIDTAFSDISAQCACQPVLTAATALAQKSPVRDPRAELLYILAAAEDLEKQEKERVKEEKVEEKEAVPEQELQTFSASRPQTPTESHKPKFRSRETRANSRFLRLYAHDTAARAHGRLPMLNSPEELALLRRIPTLRRFDKNHDLARISALSCKKLWDAVVLPPRADPLPKSTVDSYAYLRVEAKGGLVIERGRNGSKVVPWAPHRKWVPPAGQMGTGQYTVKGWVPSRLVSKE